jgi:MFS superfamily sulfate permease-like transporter
MGDIDYSGSETLGAVHEELASQGVTLVLADVDEKVRRELDAYGLTARIGGEHVFPTIPAMIAAFPAAAPPVMPTASTPGPPPAPAPAPIAR